MTDKPVTDKSTLCETPAVPLIIPHEGLHLAGLPQTVILQHTARPHLLTLVLTTALSLNTNLGNKSWSSFHVTLSLQYLYSYKLLTKCVLLRKLNDSLTAL